MKARSFLISIAAVLLILTSITVGLMWTISFRSPLRISENSLELPRAAQFVPRNASMTLHWFADPVRLPFYAQAISKPSERRKARENLRIWRNDFFRLAGLDFETELEPWIGPQISLSLIDSIDGEGGPGWVLALTSRNKDGARRFLQRFWQSRSFAGTELEVSSYRGLGVISARGAFLGQEPRQIATALIDDQMLLMASGRGALEKALYVSQLENQQQLGEQNLNYQVKNLRYGMAIMVISKRALVDWFQLPQTISNREDFDGLVVDLRAENNSLIFNGLLRFYEEFPDNFLSDTDDLLSYASGKSEVVAKLQNPSRLLDPLDVHPFAQWFGPILRKKLESLGEVSDIVELNEGPLLWVSKSDGWILVSKEGYPQVDKVNRNLENKGRIRCR